jgi:hypothetical protein
MKGCYLVFGGWLDAKKQRATSSGVMIFGRILAMLKTPIVLALLVLFFEHFKASAVSTVTYTPYVKLSSASIR